jgi:hypothetical protein
MTGPDLRSVETINFRSRTNPKNRSSVHAAGQLERVRTSGHRNNNIDLAFGRARPLGSVYRVNILNRHDSGGDAFFIERSDEHAKSA